MSVSVLLARGLAQAVEKTGFDPSALLKAARIDPVRLDDVEGRLDIEEYDRLLATALDLTGNPALGLRIGELAHGPTYNLSAYLVAHSRTLRDGMLALVRFHRLLSDRPVWRVAESRRTATLICDEYPGPESSYRLRTEMQVTGVYRMVQYFAADARPVRVAFNHGAPSYRNDYTRVFGGLERFDQPLTGIVVSRGLLDATQANGDPRVLAVLEAEALQRIARMSRRTMYAEQLREYVTDHPLPEERTIEAAARAFGMSSRSLRRRLHEEGASFRQVVDGVLYALSRHYLSNQLRSIKEISWTFGFGDQANFCRAFRRWSGTSPKQYRSRKLETSAACRLRQSDA
jgi:AraC-like DNA-binding protein